MTGVDIKEIIGDYNLFLRILLGHLKEKGIDSVIARELPVEKVTVSRVGTSVACRDTCQRQIDQYVQAGGTTALRRSTRRIGTVGTYGRATLAKAVTTTTRRTGTRRRIDARSDAKTVLEALNKELNADVEFEFVLTEQEKREINHPEERMSERRTFSAKFHHQSLEKVIEIELEMEKNNHK
ncbi:dihydroxybiphenyl dioxygenase domain-containing protein [Heterostelium album PN500]|uniref:Dihydroxybiphenyl dioxygenase domain-containing protein n=1 Tax=Heterostelium pallidum (strain ATCC 26659 / Pp 5 / PN500) TaxID=670386 RepID=D3BIN3_HETP5|nr:dihydroxybiphenyl dioxygenase domain-containing protein [Heterostelium album PN500]EFA78657.1 dihydroxybiphenyl dioxygenase domain-containing protein [Heterostelium album PN500]|eukprot:XP_020430781.1 dihydroxybiphenyl dioxygenase domain-containing protein [Heterostelium album PN500]